MKVMLELIKSRKSFLLGERDVPDTVYLNKDDLKEVNEIIQESMVKEKEYQERIKNFLKELIPATTPKKLKYGDLILGMEIVYTDDKTKSKTVAKLINGKNR